MSSVRDFGATGDGVADDTAALEHALADGDGLLVFPRGDYRLTRPLRIDLASARRTGIDGSGGTARLIMDAPGPALEIVGTHGGTADPRSLMPSVVDVERLPTVRGIEIVGRHPEADGIRLAGVMQPTITGVLLRSLRHGIHLTQRARNVLVSHCHIYRNTGVGILLDHCDLHQTVIVGNHVSYCRLGGIRVEGGGIRNLQITGNDIEYNTNAALGVPDGDEPSAEIFIDAREGSIREGTIASNTIQATATAGGANIRFIGADATGSRKVGMWTITGNLIGSQTTNIHLTSALGFAITGNYLYSGHARTILVEDSRALAIGANCIGHNPDYGDRGLSPGIRLVDCRDVAVTGLVIQDLPAGRNTVAGAVETTKEALVELVRCRRVTLTGCQLLDAAPVGLLVEDCHDLLVTGCTILDGRETPLMERAIRWRATTPPRGCGVHACRLDDLELPEAVATSANVVGRSVSDG
jgi:hypothetical protein